MPYPPGTVLTRPARKPVPLAKRWRRKYKRSVHWLMMQSPGTYTWWIPVGGGVALWEEPTTGSTLHDVTTVVIPTASEPLRDARSPALSAFESTVILVLLRQLLLLGYRPGTNTVTSGTVLGP
jgi:hypothetical protein